MSYQSTQAHLVDELERIRDVLTTYESHAEDDTTPEEPTETVDGDTPVSNGRNSTERTFSIPQRARKEFARRRREIEARCEETEETTLHLRVLADQFDLTRAHVDVLLMAISTEIDDEFRELFWDLQGDDFAAAPTVGLIEDLYGVSEKDRLTASELVGPSSPLVRHGFVHTSEPSDSDTSGRYRRVVPDERLVRYLKGHDELDPELSDAARLVDPETTLADLRLDQPVRERVERVADVHQSGDTQHIYYFYGPDGSERHAGVEAVVDTTQRLFRVDLGTVVASNRLGRLRREALLHDCPVHLTNVTDATVDASDSGDNSPQQVTVDGETTASEQHNLTLEEVIEALAPLDRTLFLTGSDEWKPASDSANARYELVEFPQPSFELRERLWETYAEEFAADVDTTVLANTFELTQGQIDDAVVTARSVSRADNNNKADNNDKADSNDKVDSGGRVDSGSDRIDNDAGSPHDQTPALGHAALVEGCKTQLSADLTELAEQIQPSADWGDIVLRDRTSRKLFEVAAHITHRGTVYDEWEFGERFPRGTGVIALFAGVSGTGKTLAAEVIANNAGMDLYKINLSNVVSKYIGETEENLEQLFDAAAGSNSILLFDEADAVFGKRADVADATDRYANVEVDYLLQRIETYEGVVLLTTNKKSAIDDAFRRRITHNVEFKPPDEEARRQIWELMFPDAAPTGHLDYEFLASFEITGGTIRSAVQTAAVLGAADDGVVRMSHVVEAVRRELHSIGKLLDRADFEPYDHYLDTDGTESQPASGPDGSDTDASTAGTSGRDVTVVPNDESRKDSRSGASVNGRTPSESTNTASPSRESTNSPSPSRESTNSPSPSRESTSTPSTSRESTDTSDESERGDSDPTEGEPEDVVRAFFSRLEEGDGRGAHSLYHSRGSVEQFSPKELAIMESKGLSIGGFERVREDSRRIVVLFTQALGEEEKSLKYELRLEDGRWRIFSTYRGDS